jgi:hypothetical protein
MQISIPFKERFREPMLNGTKTMTSRTKCYGIVGDWFNAFGKTYVLTSVIERHFDFIVNHWKEEGCFSREDFLGVWKEIHPRHKVSMTDKFWTHSFQSISPNKAPFLNGAETIIINDNATRKPEWRSFY